MFVINADKSIYLTRGDIASIVVSASKANGEDYIFQIGDTVRFRVMEKKNCDDVILCKDVVIDSESLTVDIRLTGDETKIGETISKPDDYWYEVELNPDTDPQTIIGYDSDGPKIFRLFPEGGNVDG
jgi:hypothetical protein